MSDKYDIDLYIIGEEYCPYCKFFLEMDECKLKIGKKDGKAYCINFKEELN